MSVCLYPLTPHFYIVKLGFTGVYNAPYFHIFALKHILWVLVSTHNISFEQKYEKISKFFI